MTRSEPADDPAPDLHGGEGYTGPGELAVAGTVIAVHLDLRGAFQPIDGRFHWQGRVAAASGLDSLAGALPGGSTSVAVRTAYGESIGHVSDPDPWGRLRLTGTGTPPFPV